MAKLELDTAELQDACNLAYLVAREDVDGETGTTVPKGMRSFLYLDKLPRRAFVVAQKILDSDSEFRARVAQRATETDVGSLGYVWLQRPEGWEEQYKSMQAELHSSAQLEVPQNGNGKGLAEVGEFQDSDVVHEFDDVDRRQPPLPSAALSLSGNAGDASGEAGSDSEVDAIENELSNLRGLVDSLAGARDLVNNMPVDVETNGSPARFDVDYAELKGEFESIRHELNLKQTDLINARRERDEAQNKISDALTSQATMERELSLAREETSALQNQLAETNSQMTVSQDQIGRLEASAIQTVTDLESIRIRAEQLTGERDEIREQRITLRVERDDLLTKLAMLEEKLGDVDPGELVAANATLATDLEGVKTELSRLQGQISGYETQLRDATTTAASLQTEKIDLSARLADSELSLETTTTQLKALKKDSERMAAELGTLRAERDGLQTQLSELQQSLGDVLNEQASTRQKNDADRQTLNELRSERDRLKAELADIEYSDADYQIKLQNLLQERDEMARSRDDLANQRAELKVETAAANTELVQHKDTIAEYDSKWSALETELQSERRQREELASRLLEMDDVIADTSSVVERLTAERDQLTASVDGLKGEQISVTDARLEADNLRVRLRESERRYDEEVARNRSKVEELTGKVGSGDSDRTSLEQQLAEVQAELKAVRSELEQAHRQRSLSQTEESSASVGKKSGSVKKSSSTKSESTSAAKPKKKSRSKKSAPAVPPEPPEANRTGQLPKIDLSKGRPKSVDDVELDQVGDLISQAVTTFDVDKKMAAEVAAGLSGPKRRQIEVPADIADDPLAVARHVVAAEDVVLLVDGDSVARIGWPSLSLLEQRDALVTYLADLAASSGTSPDVVFDGRLGDENALPSSRVVRIRLSTAPTEPSAALDELVDAYPEQWPIALVTDEPGLASSGSARGASILSNGQLLDLFIAE